MGSCMSGMSNRDATDGHPPWWEKPRRKLAQKKAERAFRKANPEYKNTRFIDRLRKRDYPALDRGKHVYLDYTGSGLYARSQLSRHHELLRRNVFGNPHSINPTSQAMTDLDERARAAVLKFFRASPDEYEVVFTANASHALKLLGEAYPFAPGGEYLLFWDNHNSVQGIREYAREKGAAVTYVPLVGRDMRVDESALRTALLKEKHTGPRLFAYPAQSNFSGVQHSLDWIAEAQAFGWDVLLDAAAFVPTNRLDLSVVHPDFVSISFYKMFGYPSGVGCLIARRSALARLNRPWFAGGTVWGSSVQAHAHVLLEGHESFEDGTINFLNLPAVQIGLDHLRYVGVSTIHKRVTCLTGWLLDALRSLRHSNGHPVVEVYGPESTHGRGGTIAFNFLDPRGRFVDERIVEQRAASARWNISLRTGCFCNPGAGEAAFRLSQDLLLKAFEMSGMSRAPTPDLRESHLPQREEEEEEEEESSAKGCSGKVPTEKEDPEKTATTTTTHTSTAPPPRRDVAPTANEKHASHSRNTSNASNSSNGSSSSDRTLLAFDDFLLIMGMPPGSGGGVRVSLGLVSNFADVYRFVEFARTFIDQFPVGRNIKPRVKC